MCIALVIISERVIDNIITMPKNNVLSNVLNTETTFWNTFTPQKPQQQHDAYTREAPELHATSPPIQPDSIQHEINPPSDKPSGMSNYIGCSQGRCPVV